MNSINRPAGFGKRFLGALIDIFVIFFLTVLINTYIATPIANNAFDLEVKEKICADYQEQYYIIARDDYAIGTYEREDNSISFTYSEEFSALSEEDQKVIVEAFNNDIRIIDLSDNYIMPAVQELNNIYFILVSCSIAIPELIIFLLIPLFVKRSATPGQLIMKIGTVHKDDFEAKNFQLVLRFLTVLLIETLLVFYFFNYFALLLSPVICLIIMATNSNRNCLHDILSSTKVVSNDAIIFKDYNDKLEYLNQREKSVHMKKTYDADTQELRENFKFIDEQEQRILNNPDSEE